jgi:hypothetical protein
MRELLHIDSVGHDILCPWLPAKSQDFLKHPAHLGA